jgi:hypothetical protein
MGAILHRETEVPLFTLILLLIAIGSPTGVVRWTVGLLAVGMLVSAMPAAVRKARRRPVSDVARDVDAADETAADLDRLDDDGGPASSAESASADGAQPAITRAAKPSSPRKDTHLTPEDSPERPGIDAQRPSSMPRAEDDELTRARSPEFHDRPGSGQHTADRHNVF